LFDCNLYLVIYNEIAFMQKEEEKKDGKKEETKKTDSKTADDKVIFVLNVFNKFFNFLLFFRTKLLRKLVTRPRK